jgi:hypothetical protein
VLQIDAGTILDDATVRLIVSYNTQLQEVILNRAPRISDKSVTLIIKKCPSIVIIKITGIDEQGLIFGRFANFMNRKETIESRNCLQAIYIGDQLTKIPEIKSVSRKWPDLLISTGRTVKYGFVSPDGIETSHWVSEYWRGGNCFPIDDEKTYNDMGYQMPKVVGDLMRFQKPVERLDDRWGPKRPMRAESNASISHKRPAIMKTEDTTPFDRSSWEIGYSGSGLEEDDEEIREKDDDEDDDESEEEDEEEAYATDHSEPLPTYEQMQDEWDMDYVRGVKAGYLTPPVYERYQSDKPPPSRRLCYKTIPDWKLRWLADFRRTGIQMIEFNASFRITE